MVAPTLKYRRYPINHAVDYACGGAVGNDGAGDEPWFQAQFSFDYATIEWDSPRKTAHPGTELHHLFDLLPQGRLDTQLRPHRNSKTATESVAVL